MAPQRMAHIVQSQQLGSEAKLLDLTLLNDEPLNFIGGQYIIVNTNIQLPGGKIAKRAYSIISKDKDTARFQIVVKKLGSGPGSNHMHTIQSNGELAFSGPWGQFLADESTSAESTLVLATDTGITAALGLVQSSLFNSRVKKAKLIWMVESEDYFIPKSFVEGLLSDSGISFEVKIVPPPNHGDRLKIGQDLFRNSIDQNRPETAFLSGDGALLYPFKEELLSRAVAEKQIKIECFFNNPFKKIAS